MASAKIKLQVEVDKKLFNKLEEIFTERGISIERYVGMHLRMLAKTEKLLELHDDITFGKYAGEVVEDVCRGDPSYVQWLLQNSRKPCFAPEVLELIEELGKK